MVTLEQLYALFFLPLTQRRETRRLSTDLDVCLVALLDFYPFLGLFFISCNKLKMKHQDDAAVVEANADPPVSHVAQRGTNI